MKLALSFLFFIILCTQVQASHLIGSNISYEHISGDSFKVNCEIPIKRAGTFFFNGNCVFGGPPATATTFNIYCPDQGFLDTIVATFDTQTYVGPVCRDTGYNSCFYGPCAFAGMRYYNISAIVDFSTLDTSQCSEWMFIWVQGARTTTLNFVGQPNMIAWSSFNKNDFPTNNAVQIKTRQPIPFYCEGEAVSYNWGAVDPDGDSLQWELDTSRTGFSGGVFTPLTYASGYGAFNPVPGPMTINNLTGELQFTTSIPTGYDVANYAVAVNVYEYDRETGEHIGTLHREIQIIVADSCDNEAPIAITDITSTAQVVDSASIQTCKGQDIEIEIVYTDYDSNGALTSDSLGLSTDIGDYVDNATYSVSGTNPDTLRISVQNYVPTTDYQGFNVFVSDNNCPFTGFNTYT